MLGRFINYYRKGVLLDLASLSNRSGISVGRLKSIEEGEVIPPIKDIEFYSILKGLYLKEKDFQKYKCFNRPRKFKIYGVGLTKTGTTSLAAIFNNYWSDHEFNKSNTYNNIIEYKSGQISKNEFASFVMQRDKKSGFLEMDSSDTNRYYIDIVAEQIKESKFIFLIRDCFSWVNSYVNFNTSPHVQANYTKYKINAMPYAFPPGDNSEKKEYIKNFDKYIDLLLSYWSDENTEILKKLENLPPERYIVIRTNELSSKIKFLSEFAGVSPDTLIENMSHVHKTKKNINILDKLDYNFLNDKFNKYCKELMNRYFQGYTLKKYLSYIR